eukprot:TRINITY_DN9469_c0_g1_i1.p1 TRINITY_DN9469_c0_g1~~TRINITY_DN9469_c0_g1_i1.p1  ORF type:complete len:238 (-),score=47.21 TRINITY_DN9469_c0_g1_i1:131-844(-)
MSLPTPRNSPTSAPPPPLTPVAPTTRSPSSPTAPSLCASPVSTPPPCAWPSTPTTLGRPLPPGKRQVGYLAALTDDTHCFSLLHLASHRSGRVCRGSTAGELLALADAFAAALDVRLLLQELLGQRVPIAAYIDSATAYNLVTSFKDPADMSGKNDLFMLRLALLTDALSEVNHVHGSENPADALSKPTFSRPAPNAALTRALTSGILYTPVVSHTTTDGLRNKPHRGITLRLTLSA